MPVVVNVEKLMRARGIETQSELAKKAGIHPTRLGPYVHGTIRQINLATLGKLCRALECNPGDLLTYED